MGRIKMVALMIALGIGLLATDSPLVKAQGSSDTEEFTLEEITVTATKRAENLQKIAISATAIEGEKLSQQAQTTLQDILRDTPGVEMRGGGGLTGLPFIRGVGDNAGGMGVEMGVAVNTNGVTATVQSLNDRGSAAYDVDRVEVTRGPDSTLNGRSAVGGTISIITNEPKKKFEGNASLQIGNYKYYSTVGTINVPVGEQFALRASFNSVKRNGFLMNGQNELDNFSTRFRALYEPNDKLKAIVSAEVIKYGGKGKAESQTGPIDLTQPFTMPKGAFYNPALAPNFDGGKRYVYYLDLTYDFGWASLYFQPTYQDGKFNQARYSRSWILTPPIDDIPDYWNYEAQARKQKQTTYELRLTSPDEGRFIWLAGYYYTDFEEWTLVSPGPPNATTMPTITYPKIDPVTTASRFTTDNAFYAQATYKLSDTLNINFGGRYTKDDKSRNASAGPSYSYNLNDGIANSTTGTRVFYGVPYAKITTKNEDFKVSLQKDLTPDTMVYGLVSTGFKGGGYNNLPADESLIAPGYKNFFGPEYVRSFEVGTKNQLMDNQFRLNASAFYYNYRDIQLSFQAPALAASSGVDPDFRTNVRQNGGKAVTYGVEVETNYLATRADRIKLNVNYLHSTFVKMKFQPLIYLQDMDMPQAPAWRISGNYDHTFDLGNSGSLVAAIDGTYVTSLLFKIQNTAISPYNKREAQFKANASVSYYSVDGKWTVSGYVKNVFDKQTLDSIQLPSRYSGYGNINFDAADPRTYGVTLSASF